MNEYIDQAGGSRLVGANKSFQRRVFTTRWLAGPLIALASEESEEGKSTAAELTELYIGFNLRPR